MPNSQPKDLVATVMLPIADDLTPPILQASIERQSLSLMGLATSLFQSGMEEEKVRAVIEKAYSSYRDELITVILALRKPDGT